ncbi:MAG: C10 family peptidase [Bacteroidales bacterium]|nr:C10 family peptidase [Bacteroidales bacterium]
MRKRLYLGVLLLLTLSCININAEVITLDGATELANTFFSQNVSQQKRLLKSATPQLEYAWDSNSLTQSGNTLLKNVEEDPTFYVFNNPDGVGFVIVSGDDNAHQVIGYSYESNAPVATEIPEPMKDYLLGIDSEIKWARTNLTSANKNLKATEAETGGTVVKYYETATWGQRAPLNRFCYTNATETSIGITGCVPLAYAIIMKYHEWPDEGIGNLCNMYTGASITNRTYDWSKMLMSYTGTYTDEQADEAAKLIQHIGHAFQTDHSTGESTLGGSTNYLNKFFNYNFVNSALQANYTIENWQLAIEESLDNGCPIPYKSKNSGTGDSQHIFIVDGYTDNNYYHFNFGWFGNGNGWFQITAITPSTGDDYSWNESSVHEAFFNFKPNKKVTVSVAVDPESAGSVTIDGTSVSSKEVDAGASVTLQATGDNFYGWLVDGVVVSTETSYTFAANKTATYTAKFATPVTLTLYPVLMEDGTPSFDDVNSVSATTTKIVEGVEIELTAYTKRGYTFLGWYKSDGTTLISGESSYTLSITSEIVNEPFIYAQFSQLTPATFTVASSDESKGTATWSFNDGQGDVYPGEQITLTATPKSGYMFTGWSVDGVTISTSKNYTVAVEEGKTYTANFALSGADYTVNNTTGTKTNVSGARCSTWTYNTTETNPVPLQLTSTAGSTEVYGLSNNYDRLFAYAYDVNTTGYNTITYTLSVPEGYIITGYEMTYWLGSSSYAEEEQVTVSNSTSTNTPTDTSDQTLYASGLTEQTTSFTVSASQAGQQYICFSSFVVSVLSTGGGEGGGEVTPTQYTVTVSAEPATAGTVAIGSATGPTEQTVDSGATVTLVASANSGYTFVNWTKGTETVSTEATFTTPAITANADYVANFTEEGNDENTLALIASAKELKNKTGIGYPNETERATLQSAIETAEANPTAAAGETLQSAIDAYYATTNVQMPTAGTTYSFIVGHDLKAYIYNNGGTLALASYTEGDELPDEAKFTCEISDGKYLFKTSDNKYMPYPKQFDGALQTSTSDYTKFNIIKVVKGGNVEVENNLLFGMLYLQGKRDGTTTGEDAAVVVKFKNNGTLLETPTFDAADAPFGNDNYSSAISMIEIPVATTYTASVTVNPAEGGTATVNGEQSVSVTEGTSVTFTATTNTGYNFLGWYNEDAQVNENLEFTQEVTSDLSLTAKYEKQTFIVSATPEGTSGTVTVSPNGTVEYGTEVTFTATANAGYRFTSWSNGETANPYVTTITANTELTANFEKQSVEEVYATICKPTFTGTGNNTYVKAAQVYGKSIEIPSELLNNVQRGYVPTPIEVVAGSEFVLDLNFVKNFNDIRIYQIENEDTSNPAYTYGPYEGSWVESGNHPDPFEAMAADGITVNGTTASFPLTFSESLAVGELAVVRVAIGDVTTPCASVSGEGGYLDFLFVMTEPSASRTISAEANPVEGGTVTGAATAEGPITLTATPNDGYEFVNWTLNGNIVSTALSITDNSSESKTYVANFNKLKEKAPQLTVVTASTNFATYQTNSIDNIKDNNYGTKFWSNGNQEVGKYVQVDLGNIYRVEDIVLYFAGDDQPDAAAIEISETGADDSWTEVASFVNGDIKSETENETTVNTYSCSTESNARYARMRITTAKSVWFQMQEFKVYGTSLPRTVKVQSSDIVKGSVFITSPKQEDTGTGGTGAGGQSLSVTTNEDVTVLATANPGYRFVNWTIDGNQVGTETTYTYTDDESATITANFEEIPEIFTVRVTVNDRTKGKATMSVTESSVEEGTSVTFTATPYTGYEFVNWTNAGGTSVSTSATYTTTIDANTALTANFQVSTSLGGRWFRIKDNASGKYLNAANYDAHATGPVGGVNVITLDSSDDDQIFLFTKSGSNYTLTTKSGYNIVGQNWNVDALTTAGTAFTFVDNGNGTYSIMKGSTYFKVEVPTGYSDIYPYCDAAASDKATWVLEEVFISDINVTKTTATAEATINVTTDAPATITVGTQTYTTTAENLTIEIPISATSNQDIEIEAVGGKVTSVECSNNVAPTEIPSTVTELALRNVNAAEVAIDAPQLEKITVVSEAPAYDAEGEEYDYNVATLSAISDLSMGVQVVVEKEINTPQPIEGKGTPSYFNFLSMPFAFNTADIKYWDGDSWEPAVAETHIRIMTYNSEIRAQGKYGETWEKVAAGASIDIAANQGFVIVGNNNYGGADADYKMKLQFTSAEAAYSQNGSAKSVETVENNNGGTSHIFDENWNHIGAPYLTKVTAPEGKTIYTHTGYNYEQYVPADDPKTINPYQGFMLQSVGSISLEAETAVAALSLTKASESVYAKAYISVDDCAPAKIILSDESSENFVLNEDAWYMAPTANVISSNYFIVDGMEASVTVQPEASDLPMTVYAGAGTSHTISLTRIEGERNVYLKDALTDEIICLNEEDYTFTSSAKTTIANRFTISMTEPTGIIESAISEGTIKVVVSGDNIKMYGTVEGTDITLYNTNGMVITNAVAEEGVTTVATSATGVIVIKADNTVVKVVK